MTGCELRAIRSEWGMTQREFAQFLTYTDQQVSKMERGEAKIPEIIEKFVLLEQKLRAIKNLVCTP